MFSDPYVCTIVKTHAIYSINIVYTKYNVINVRDKIDSSVGEGQINDLQNLI